MVASRSRGIREVGRPPAHFLPHNAATLRGRDTPRARNVWSSRSLARSQALGLPPSPNLQCSKRAAIKGLASCSLLTRDPEGRPSWRPRHQAPSAGLFWPLVAGFQNGSSFFYETFGRGRSCMESSLARRLVNGYSRGVSASRCWMWKYGQVRSRARQQGYLDANGREVASVRGIRDEGHLGGDASL